MRTRRLEILRSLGNGEVKVEEIVRSPPLALKSCDLWSVLIATYNLGPVGARIICEKAEVFPALSLDTLTKAERYRIIKHLPERAK